MKKILCTARIGAVLLIMLSTFNLGFAQCKLSYDNYYPMFVEEFNYSYTGTTVFNNNNFSSRWVLGDPCDAQGDIERSYYDPNQVTIASGPLPETDGYILRLTAEKLTTPITSCIDANSPNEHLWKSGRIETNPLCTLLDDNSHINWGQGPGAVPKGWAYGIFEIKCKLPNDPNTPNVWDVWPAFWLISATTEIDPIDATKSNPDELLECGMIDWGHYPAVSPWWTEILSCNPASHDSYNPLQTYSGPPTAANNYNIVSYNGKCYQPNIGYIPQAACGRRAKKIGGPNLSAAYHVYSVVWTPESVTFFLNGREIMTIPSSRVETTNYPAKIIAELQMYGGPDSPGPFYMDIDWIKVWKPRGVNGLPDYPIGGSPTTFVNYPNALDYYLSDNEYINHNIHEEGVFNGLASNTIGVHPEKGSIAFTDDPNQVFYRGTDNRIYKATYNVSYWSVERLEYNYPNPPMPAVLVGGALNFISGSGQNIITYVGQDGRLQFFGYDNGWYHWWIDDDFTSSDARASFKDPSNASDYLNVNISSVAINVDKDIFYKGYDYKLHKFHHDGTDWIHSVIGQGTGNERVYGDILTASNGTRNVFYTGFDMRLQEFWSDGSNYHHNWIDNPSNPTTHKIKPLSGSMALKNNYEIIYIGQDHRIQQYSWTLTGWVHTWVGEQTFAYPSLARPRNGIGWNGTGGNNAIVYGGEDGRIQCLKNNGGTWSHSWINDYTNTTIYNSFLGLTSITINAKSPDIKISTDGKIFYIGSFDNKGVSKNHLRYFNMESCQEIETVCEHVEATYGTLKNALLNTQNHENKSEDLTAKVYPNPTDNKLSVEIQGADFKYNTNTAIISNIAGQILLQIALTSEISELDISDFPAGVYFIQITNGEKSLTEKIIKR